MRQIKIGFDLAGFKRDEALQFIFDQLDLAIAFLIFALDALGLFFGEACMGCGLDLRTAP